MDELKKPMSPALQSLMKSPVNSAKKRVRISQIVKTEDERSSSKQSMKKEVKEELPMQRQDVE